MRHFLRILLIGLLLIHFSSCTRSCHFYDVYGANEFVIDSHKIRQGKLSILEMEGVLLFDVPPSAMEEYEDLIAEDDILNIAFYHPKRRDLIEAVQYINEQVGFRVQEGKITFPDVAPVHVAGFTLDEARLRLQFALEKEIQDAEVFLSYRDRLARKVELTGAVALPVIPVDGKIRLYEVLARAQVSSQANFFKSYVVREGVPLALDLHKLMNQGDMTQNIVMRGGDKVFIAHPSDSNVMVMGEVLVPRAVNVPYGFISLREALVHAGGIPFTGNRNCIQVIRGNLRCPKIYVLAWDHVIHLPNDSLLLMPGDTVFVTEKPITKWNRFIDQLLPSYIGLEKAYTAYQLFKD